MLASKIIGYFRRVDMVRYAEDISNVQSMEKFNAIWKYAYTNYSFYKDYKIIHGLPDSVTSLQQILSFPFITKDEIKKKSKIILKEANVTSISTTGGTSGTPLTLPFSKVERVLDYRNIYGFRRHVLGKSQTSTLLLWGHSHLFGKGVLRHFRQAIRVLKDSILGIKRISAYGAIDNLCQQAISIMRKKKFDFLIGYSGYIVRLARKINQNFPASINDPDVIILTAESFSNNDYLEIQEAFSTSLIVTEYGTSETGVIAAGVPGSVKVFSDFLLNYDRQRGVLITTLSKRSFPLIRYSLGDFLSDFKETEFGTIVKFGFVMGRINDEISLNGLNGSKRVFSSLEIQHLIRSDISISSVQIQHSSSDGYVEIIVVINDTNKSKEFERQVLANFKSVFEEINLSSIKFSYVKDPIKTLAGKIPFKLPDRV